MTLTKRNLPHLHYEYGIYFVTFRLADSLPQFFLEQIAAECAFIKDPAKRARLEFLKIDNLLNTLKFGKNYLGDQRIANVLKNCLHYPDEKEYNLICYSIMSNHSHVIFELIKDNRGLPKIMQSIKGISARRSNLILNRSGQFWQDESYDRLLRKECEFSRALNYTLNNPVKAGLVTDWKNWKNSYCKEEYKGYITAD